MVLVEPHVEDSTDGEPTLSLTKDLVGLVDLVVYVLDDLLSLSRGHPFFPPRFS